MRKAKERYSISIFLGLLASISIIIVTASPKIDSIILEFIISFIAIGLMSHGYEITREIYTKNEASKIRKQIIIFGILIIVSVSAINYFYSSFFAAVLGALLSFVLVYILYKNN